MKTLQTRLLGTKGSHDSYTFKKRLLPHLHRFRGFKIVLTPEEENHPCRWVLVVDHRCNVVFVHLGPSPKKRAERSISTAMVRQETTTDVLASYIAMK